VLVLLAACGAQHGTASSSSALVGPASSASAKPSVPECPEVTGVVDPSPCISVGAEQKQQANQTFNSRIPLPGPVAAEAATLTAQIRQSLDRLTPAQRLQVSEVRSALLKGGMLSTDLWVFHGAASSGAGFGGYIILSSNPPACAWGTVSAKTVELDFGGITRERGCLPSAGGH
jgi:hypothetical protein